MHMDHLCATLTVFGLTVHAVLSSSEWLQIARDLDVVEIFSGVESVVTAAWERGLRAKGFDKLHCAQDDITTPEGFRRAVTLVMRLVAGGLLWLAPVCSSWVWMNSKNCKRKKDNGYRGNLTYKPVLLGNVIAEASAFLTLLAYRRLCEAAVENPIRSVIFKYRPVQQVAEALQMVPVITYRCAFSGAPYGERFQKGFRFLATGAWIEQTSERCCCPGGVHKQLVKISFSGGKRRVTGIQSALMVSGAYPRALGRRIVQSWLAHRSQQLTASSAHSASNSLAGGQTRFWAQAMPQPGDNAAAPHSTPTTRSWAKPSAMSGQQMTTGPGVTRAWQQPPP